MNDWLDTYRREARLFININAARLLSVDFLNNDNLSDEVLSGMLPH